VTSGLSQSDYKRVAKLHIENLNQSFLASLGISFLTEMYRAIDISENTALIVEFRDNQIIGFVTGGSGMGAVYKKMMSRIWVWGGPLSIRLLSIKRIKRVLEIVQYSLLNTKESLTDIPLDELFSIAVAPSFRGRGVSAGLYGSLSNYFRNNKIYSYKIIVGQALAPAHRFYSKMGAVPHGEIEVHAGEKSILYIQTLEKVI